MVLKVHLMNVKKLSVGLAALCLAATVAIGARQAPAQTQSDRLTADVLKGLEFRSIGPAISTGRIQDIAIDPKAPNTWYVATAFGGLWKTTNRGTTFAPIFDNGGALSPRFLFSVPQNTRNVCLADPGQRAPPPA